MMYLQFTESNPHLSLDEKVNLINRCKYSVRHDTDSAYWYPRFRETSESKKQETLVDYRRLVNTDIVECWSQPKETITLTDTLRITQATDDELIMPFSIQMNVPLIDGKLYFGAKK